MIEERRKNRKWTKEEREQAKKLRAEGKEYKQIGDILGRSKGSVCGMLFYMEEKENKKEEFRETVKSEKEGFRIGKLKKDFYVGQKVRMLWGIGSKKPQKHPQKGVITGKYNHHVVIKFQNGIRESFQYFDLLGVVM